MRFRAGNFALAEAGLQFTRSKIGGNVMDFLHAAGPDHIGDGEDRLTIDAEKYITPTGYFSFR